MWCGLTTFGKGLVLALSGIIIQSTSILVKDNTLSLILATTGIMSFIPGLYMALAGMDKHSRNLSKCCFLEKVK